MILCGFCRTTLYPVGSLGRPDHYPACCGNDEAGKAGAIFVTACWPWGTSVHAHPVSTAPAADRRGEPVYTFSTAPSGTVPRLT
jgi:hypothetical protein